MLSMKRSTSRPSSSRKYSAIVRPVRATRRRTPGGSFICPYTRAVLSSTPDSRLSCQRPLPSREVVARPGAPAHAGEHGEAAVLGREVSDQLGVGDGLAGAGAAEEADL